MSEDLASFYTDLMEDVRATALALGEYTRKTLVENLATRLVVGEELQDWKPCFFEGKGHRNRALGVDGYSEDELELDGTLQVLIAEYRDGSGPGVLNTGDVNSAYGRASGFVSEALAGRLHEELEPSTEAADLAKLVHARREDIRAVRIIVLSNAALGSRYREETRRTLDDRRVELHIWDLARFEQMAGAGGREAIEIDVTELVPEGLPGLPAGLGDAHYDAYLLVVPGRFLADAYDRYGSRLLEGNVRAFLSVRGNVNKGIRKTLASNPSRFFAFNNGITATATSVEKGAGDRVTRIKDLQIVNGGQTTASLYNAVKRDGLSLDGVFVQMKLSVLSPEEALAMIPDIARFANTQNKVSEADLFANHPFNRRVEEISRRLWAPPRTGTHHQTHWFYERARAQYQTEQTRLTPSTKKAFLLQNPKSQVLTKTDIAKFENTWRRMPHIVSGGAQKNFVKYAAMIGVEYDASPEDINERWFRHLVAKAILFRGTEMIVSAAGWYSGGYRANVVTYAIARLVLLVEQAYPGRILDLDHIWKAQEVPKVVALQLERIGEQVLTALMSPPTAGANVTEWAKKEACWNAVSNLQVDIIPGLSDLVKPLGEERGERRLARKEEREEGMINAVVEVVKRSQDGFWARALAWPTTRRLLLPVEYRILDTAANGGSAWVPSDAQARHLISTAKKLEDAGLK